MKLNLGCGSCIVEGWVNVDWSIGARMARVPLLSVATKWLGLFRNEWSKEIFIHNLSCPFPWSSNSIDVCYSSHTLEHLDRDDGMHFLRECHRVLKPGGILRVVVPDLNAIVSKYSEGSLIATEFLDELGVLFQKPNNRVKRLLLPFISFPHKCMYDQNSLLSCFRMAGFNARLACPFQSEISGISLIEHRDRIIEAVIVEGIK